MPTWWVSGGLGNHVLPALWGTPPIPEDLQTPPHFLDPSPQASQPPGPASGMSTTFSIKGEDFAGRQDVQVTTSRRPVRLRAQFPSIYGNLHPIYGTMGRVPARMTDRKHAWLFIFGGVGG